MSIFSKEEKYAIPAPGSAYVVATPALQFRLTATNGLMNVTYYNQGKEIYYPAAQSGNDMTIKMQDSADGSAWADVTNSTKTVVPMGEQACGNLNVRQHIRVLAYGNTEGVVKIAADETLDVVIM